MDTTVARCQPAYTTTRTHIWGEKTPTTPSYYMLKFNTTQRERKRKNEKKNKSATLSLTVCYVAAVTRIASRIIWRKNKAPAPHWEGWLGGYYLSLHASKQPRYPPHCVAVLCGCESEMIRFLALLSSS